MFLFSAGPATTTVGTTEQRPPVQFTPQSETEKRIMEILNNSAGLAARTQQEAVEKSPGKVKGGESQGNPNSGGDQKSAAKKSEAGDSLQMVSSMSASVSSNQPSYTIAVSQAASYHSENTDADDQQEENILPMNVMIHQSIPQSAAIACPVPQVPSSTSSHVQEMDTATPTQETNLTPQTTESSLKAVEGSAPSDHGHSQEKPPTSGSADIPSAPNSSSSVSTAHDAEPVSTSFQQAIPQSYPVTSMPGHPFPPPNMQERMSPRGMVPPSYVGGYGQFHGRMSPRQAPFGGPQSGQLMSVPQNQSPRQSTTPSPGRYSPRQASPSYPAGPSPGRYSPRQGSPGVSRPPSRPPSQPGPGYTQSPRQGPSPHLSGYPSSTPPASPCVTHSPAPPLSVAASVESSSSKVEASVAQSTINSTQSVPTCSVHTVVKTPTIETVATTQATNTTSAQIQDQSNVNVQNSNTSVNVSQSSQVTSARNGLGTSVSSSEHTTVTTGAEPSQETVAAPAQAEGSKDAEQ